MKDLKEKLLEEIKRLLILNYSVDEIIYYLSKNYRIEPYLLKELIVQNFSLIYKVFSSVDKRIIILSLLSFLFLSLIFNVSSFSILFLLFLFYFVVVIDYLAFEGKFSLPLSYFFVSILFFIFWIVSLFTFYNKFFPLAILPFITIPYLVNKVLSEESEGIFKFSDSLVEFYKINFILIIFLGFITLSFLIFSFLPLEYNILILIVVFTAWFFFIKDKKVKLFSFFVFIIFIIKVLFMANNFVINSLKNVQETYLTKLNYKILCPFYGNVNISEFKLLSLLNGKKTKNKTLSEKYKNISIRLINSQCTLQLDEFFPEFSNPFEYYLITSTFKSSCSKKIEEELNKKLKKEFELLKSKINKTDFDYEVYKKLTNYLLNINYYSCLNEMSQK